VTAIPTQLTLGISLDDEARFENFLVTERNQQLVSELQSPDYAEPFLYFWSNASCGRTHLLQAICHEAGKRGASAIYLPLANRDGFDPAILEGAESLDLVCVDDVQLLAQDAQWEQALFNAFNAIKETNTCLIVTADTPPTNLQYALKDLQSRMGSGLVYQLQQLNDADKLDLLQLRARRRGIKLPGKVADYILQRAERSVPALLNTLDKIDDSSLSQQRQLTIPLVKSTMGW